MKWKESVKYQKISLKQGTNILPQNETIPVYTCSLWALLLLWYSMRNQVLGQYFRQKMKSLIYGTRKAASLFSLAWWEGVEPEVKEEWQVGSDLMESPMVLCRNHLEGWCVYNATDLLAILKTDAKIDCTSVPNMQITSQKKSNWLISDLQNWKTVFSKQQDKLQQSFRTNWRMWEKIQLRESVGAFAKQKLK